MQAAFNPNEGNIPTTAEEESKKRAGMIAKTVDVRNRQSGAIIVKAWTDEDFNRLLLSRHETLLMAVRL